MKTQSGFTLLEAVVSITLFSILSLSIYSWINSMMIGTQRFESLAVESTDLENAVDYLATLNPMASPTGSMGLGEATLTWESELIEPSRRGNMTQAFELGLYRVSAVLKRPGWPPQSLEIKQVGYRQLASEERGIGI